MKSINVILLIRFIIIDSRMSILNGLKPSDSKLSISAILRWLDKLMTSMLYVLFIIRSSSDIAVLPK